MAHAKFIFTAFIILSLTACLEYRTAGTGKTEVTTDRFGERPNLVVGITVDQMRTDYLYRYWHLYSEGGFKRMVNHGFVCSNTHYNYAPTFTGPGHASIFTGTSPAHHGIIANDWFSREEGMVYCAGDRSQKGVGTISSGGQMSPHRMLVTTISDELRLSNNFQSKVIGISMKDRGAILPAGHSANAAYWFVGKDEGNWVSSTWYMDELPQWVSEFNARKLTDDYLAQGWELLLDEAAYSISYDDNNPFEAPFPGQARAAFPYNFDDIALQRYDLIKNTPHGNSLTVDFAIESIKSEDLGSGDVPDLLALSFSTPDYVGHQFGPQSYEVQDDYLRLDRDIERFLGFLDERMGKNNYLIFLSADHGAAPVPGYMNLHKMPGGLWNPGNMVEDVKEALNKKYGQAEYILNYSGDEFFFDHEVIRKKKLNFDEIAQFVAEQSKQHEDVWHAVPTKDLIGGGFSDRLMNIQSSGIHPARSGDVKVITLPGYMNRGYQGTTHGSAYNYDTHVPLIFFGNGIKSGELNRRTHITDIAPTVARLLRIAQPGGSTGDVIYEICD